MAKSGMVAPWVEEAAKTVMKMACLVVAFHPRVSAEMMALVETVASAVAVVA